MSFFAESLELSIIIILIFIVLQKNEQYLLNFGPF
jgi:hypothetical protein